MKRTLALLFITVLGAASAQTLQAAQDTLDKGNWQEAAKAAAALNTSEGYALAARATSLGGSLASGATVKTLFTTAQEYANKAIALDSNNALAYFELARAQGRLAQTVGILQSLDIAKSMKRNLEQSIKLNPKDPVAYVALGLWHANLSSKGMIARSATGANASQVAPNFEKAIALDSTSPTHRLEYGNAMLLLGNRAAAKANYQKALTLPANTYWEKRDQAMAQAYLNKL